MTRYVPEGTIEIYFVPIGIAAQGTLTIAEPVTDTDTFTIGSTVYRLMTTIAQAYDVAIGAGEAATKVNIVAAINATGVAGTHYFAGTLAHPTVSAAVFVGDDAVITARAAGTAGNAIDTLETFTHASNIFDAGTLGTTTLGVAAVIADPTAPTAAELNAAAAVDITGQLLGDLDLPLSGSVADAGDMSSRFNKSVPGDFGGQAGSFTIQKELAAADDGVFTVLARDSEGHLAVAVRGLATPGTWASGDEVDMWPVTIMSREIQYGRNQTVRAVVTVAVTDVPTEDFVLVA